MIRTNRWQSVIPWETRFQLKVYPRGDCWEWRGGKIQGYGQFAIYGIGLPAHRVAYELAKGQLPLGKALQIDHICRHRWCVKPSHLEVVTAKTNTLRGNTIATRNLSKSICPKCQSKYTKDTKGKRYCKLCKLAGGREWFKQLPQERKAQRNRAALKWYHEHKSAS